MKVRILASASQDLGDGYRFYEKQAEGIGAYFLDTLYSDRFSDHQCWHPPCPLWEIPSPLV